MKKIILLIITAASIQCASAQRHSIDGDDGAGHSNYPYPPTSKVNGETYWCGEPIAKMIALSEFILEGRILSDSIYDNRSNDDATIIYYRVLVLKQFKGTFISETVTVQSDMLGWKKGDEALFCLYSYGNALHVLHGNGCGFVGVCNRKDINEKVYEPIESAVGHPHVEVHPNNCKGQ